jgi:hypothetical protein
MTRILLALAFSALFATGAVAADVTTQSTGALIDSLTAIDGPVIGVAGLSSYEGFIGEPRSLSMAVGVLGAPPPTIPPSMQELVRRGVAVLPDLIAHLNDARPTRLIVNQQSDDYMFRFFSNEYAARRRDGAFACGLHCLEKEFDDPYTVRVADVCFALIGQIVGRNLNAVRYQPTGGLIVNSPLQAPELAAWVRRDWQGVTVQSFRAYLIANIEAATDAFRASPALLRLRFYYPADYAALTGTGRVWRDKLEAGERTAQ